jgi:hypothetical protein
MSESSRSPGPAQGAYPLTVFDKDRLEPDLRSMTRIVLRPLGSPRPLGFFTLVIEFCPPPYLVKDRSVPVRGLGSKTGTGTYRTSGHATVMALDATAVPAAPGGSHRSSATTRTPRSSGCAGLTPWEGT